MADRIIYIIVGLLMGVGLVFSYSLPIYLENIKGWGEFYFFYKFLFFSILGIMIMYLLSQCNPDRCISKIGFGLLVGAGLLIIFMPTTFLSPYCPIIKGARRWIKIFGITISPIEFFKIGMIYFFAWGFSRKLINKNRTLKEDLTILTPYIILLSITTGYIIFTQNDLGQALLISFIFFIMLLFTQVQPKIFTILSILGIGLFLVGLSQATYRLERIKSSLYTISSFLPTYIQDMLSLEKSTHKISYQIKQSLNAIYNGGFLGKGIGNGELKMGFLSDVHTDFVLAGISEEIGVLGVLLVMVLILGLIWRIFKIANRLELNNSIDVIHQFFVIGIGLLIGLETILNIMGIVGLFPLKGLPVPFISYGGSAIISFSIGVGMVLMISKKAKL
jgi:cell division protein FtsW